MPAPKDTKWSLSELVRIRVEVKVRRCSTDPLPGETRIIIAAIRYRRHQNIPNFADNLRNPLLIRYTLRRRRRTVHCRIQERRRQSALEFFHEEGETMHNQEMTPANRCEFHRRSREAVACFGKYVAKPLSSQVLGDNDEVKANGKFHPQNVPDKTFPMSRQITPKTSKPTQETMEQCCRHRRPTVSAFAKHSVTSCK